MCKFNSKLSFILRYKANKLIILNIYKIINYIDLEMSKVCKIENDIKGLTLKSLLVKDGNLNIYPNFV